jgi:hypothetical protein
MMQQLNNMGLRYNGAMSRPTRGLMVWRTSQTGRTS